MIKKTLSYYWPHMKRYPFSGIIVFVAYFCAGLADIILPIYYKELIDTITQTADKMLLIDQALAILFKVVIIYLLLNIFFRLGDFIMTYFQTNVLRDMTNSLIQKFAKHSYTFFADNFAGSLTSKARRFSRAFEAITDQLVYTIFLTSIKLGGIFIVLFITAPLLSILFVVWTSIYVCLTIYLVKKQQPFDTALATADSNVTGALSDTITNMMIVKMFSGIKKEQEFFEIKTEDEYKKRKKSWNFHMVQFAIQGFFIVFLETVALYTALHLWQTGVITAGTIVLLQAYLLIVFASLFFLGRGLTRLFQAFADAKEMIEIFEQPEDVQDPKKPEDVRITEGAVALTDVTFSYDTETTKKPVFQDFSLAIPAGQKVGLIGHSGAGKTTITKLLLRFADVQGGAITIDGQDIRWITQDDLRRHIAYVPQEPLLFHRSLRENIAYGKDDATEAEIIAAAKKAHAHEFIAKLPQGYDTLVGERGVKLSGGERQRVAIARVMLKDAPILLLDEATSALDSTSERLIQEAFDTLMHGRTTIVIAHRLSTIQKMDRIIVLDAGTIVEEGSHTTLLQKDGLYKTFWDQQAGGFIE